MEQSKLSEYYAIASDRAMRALANFYESCHTDAGEPILEQDLISGMADVTVKIVQHELDLAVEAVKEYHEE